MQQLQPRESALKQGLVSVCASQEHLVRQLLKPLESLQRLPKENPVGDDGVKLVGKSSTQRRQQVRLSARLPQALNLLADSAESQFILHERDRIVKSKDH